jgi:hypothetical protein
MKAAIERRVVPHPFLNRVPRKYLLARVEVRDFEWKQFDRMLSLALANYKPLRF